MNGDDRRQQDDERRRAAEELAEACRIAAYADSGPRRGDWQRWYQGPDLTPWGENVAIGTAAINRQIIANRSKGVNK